MKKLLIGTVLAAACLLALAGSHTTRARAQSGGTMLTATLTGYQETPMTLASPASGQFTATVSDDGTSVSFELDYTGFETTVLVSHIHLGAPATSGGVTVFLCGGGGRPDCPSPSGTVTGTFTADDVGAIAGQGLAAGDLPKLLEAIGAGATYANVHTMAHGSGEIRGLITVVQPSSSNGSNR